jgi:hypothetical protein
LAQAVFAAVIVECLSLGMIKDKSVIKDSHFNIWKFQFITGFSWQFFPVADCIIGYVADCSSDKSELFVLGFVGVDYFFYEVKGVACFLSVYFACFFVANCGLLIFCLDG